MSTSLLYHGFGVRGYQYVRSEYVEGEIVFHLSQAIDECRCSACGSADVAPRGQVERRFRSLPLGRKPTSIVLPIPRVECRGCGAIRQVAVAFADTRRRHTKSFARYVLELSRLMTIQGRGPAPGHQLGHGQGDPKRGSSTEIRQAQAEAPATDRD